MATQAGRTVDEDFPGGGYAEIGGQPVGDKTVEAFYDADPQYEWDRLARHRMEYATTWRAMQEFLPPRAAVLDIGGGPGRYSIALAQAGHRVTLLDLSTGNIAFARAKAAELAAPVDDFLQGDALDLGRFDDGAFDAVLLMGPLYHLVREEDRMRAVAEAIRVLKTGGVLFASFITRFAFIYDLLRKKPAAIGEAWPVVENLFHSGVNLVSAENPGFTNAYFIHPTEIGPLMAGRGLTRLRLATAEGVVAAVEERICALPEPLFEKWVEVCYRLGADPTFWSAAEHLLYVGRK